MTIDLTIEGRAEAPPVLLLHSIATSAALWAPQLPVWGQHFRLIRADLPGHGGSPLLAPDADFADYARALIAALDAQRIERVSVVGLSFGAMIGLRLAALTPKRVSALVMANSVVQTPPQGRTMWLERIASVEAGGMAAQADSALARWFTPGFSQTAPLTCKWVRDLILATPPQGFCAAASAIAGLDQSSLLAQVQAPTLVVAGRHDQAAPPQIASATAAALPKGGLLELDAAHISNVEQPVAFTEAVGAFLLGAH